MSELVTFGETMVRLSPAGRARLETADALEVRTAGAESNVAIAAERLGADAAWLSKLPDSPLGRRVAGDVRRHGVDVEVCWSDDGRQGTYYLEQGTDPRGTNVTYDRDGAAVTTATVADLRADVVRDAAVFYTSGITPALSDTLRETTAELLDRADDADTRVAFDVNYRSKLWSPAEARDVLTDLFPDVDTLVVAHRDARDMLDLGGDPVSVANEFADTYGMDTVLVTRGADGATCWHDGTVTEQDAFAVETVDPIGTGDAFVGAFLARRLADEAVPAAMEYAAATAALKRTIPGDVATVTPDEVAAVAAEGDSTGISR